MGQACLGELRARRVRGYPRSPETPSLAQHWEGEENDRD
jgi:hypothetical protein